MLKLGVVLLAAAALVCAAHPREKYVYRAESPTAPPVTNGTVKVSWGSVICELKTEPTFQVVVNPMITRNTPIHNNVYRSLADLKASRIRYVPWLPYPKLAVAELEPPTATSTSWNFTLIDPLMEDFMEAAGNATVIINFSTPPTWMYDTTDWSYPSNPYEVTWDYEKGNVLSDVKKFADYYARLVSWYTEGEMVDELGVKHTSGHHYNIGMWEVLNEVEQEHHNSPATYTAQYDAVVKALQKLPHGPKEFVGMALAFHNEWDWYNYFLNASNHEEGVPLDWISYHFYGGPNDRYNPLAYEAIFPAADTFTEEVKKIEVIRKTLSPTTRTTIDEIGTILPDDNTPYPNPPKSYWAASGGMYIHLFNKLSQQQIDVLGESQLMGHPEIPGFTAPQYPSVTLLDWNNGIGNPRYWVLYELLNCVRDHKHQLVQTDSSTDDVSTQAYVRDDGLRWMMVVNKRYANITMTIPVTTMIYTIVDENTFVQPPSGRVYSTAGHVPLDLAPFATAFLWDMQE